MVTVVQTPTGHKIIDQAIEATITEDYVGDALVTYVYHGLGDGDYVYITSDIDEYNGFWYVTAIDADTFKISEHSAADFVEYYQDADIEYYQTQEHAWNSVFLPIIYKISNDLWPINNVDAAVAISSASDDNGFTNLILGGDIRTSEVNALEFVKISGSFNEELNGVWQIVEVISLSNLVLNLPYVNTNDFGGATIQYYYNNYQVKVKVFAGLNMSHPWGHKKPYELVAELSLTPDAENIAMFSIADYIKGQINIRNNPLIYSYPLNLDFFTGFYIAYTESYDNSDTYSLTTYEPPYRNNTFEGYAMAGKLPFKNTYAGDYSDYVLTSGSPGGWLTLMERLIAIEDKYFDISFIKNVRGPFWLIIDKYVSDYLMQTEVIPYEDQGVGVYRVPITPNAYYDTFCVRIHTPGTPSSGGTPATTLAALEDWVNATGAHPGAWTISATPDTSVNGSGGIEGYIAGAIATSPGYTYEFIVEFDLQVAPLNMQVIFALLDASFNEIDTVTYTYTSAGTKAENITLVSGTTGAYFGMRIINNTPINSKTVEILSAEYNALGVPDDPVTAQDITEEICIDILESCEALDGQAPLNIRLLEDGDFRLLES